MKKLELLSPAGDMEKLKMSVLYGADAVYLGLTSFGMRSFAGNFTPEELPKAVGFAHDHGVKVHVTVNTMPRSGEVDLNTPPAASGTSPPSSPWPTTPAPRPGLTWAPSGWCWPGS